MSETVKHTPGPWALDRESNDYGNQSPDAPLLGTIVGDGAHIAVVVSDLAESEANARLIAAAPDYDAAARKMVKALGIAPDEIIEGAFGADVFEALKDLRAAISKAGGSHEE